MGALYTAYCRLADGIGTNWLGTFSDRCVAIHAAQQKFDCDESVTMAWAVGPCGSIEGELLMRDPPEAGDE